MSEELRRAIQALIDAYRDSPNKMDGLTVAMLWTIAATSDDDDAFVQLATLMEWFIKTKNEHTRLMIARLSN